MLAAEAPDWQGAVEDPNEHPRRMRREDQRPQRSQSGWIGGEGHRVVHDRALRALE